MRRVQSYLEAQDLGLDVLEGTTVDLDETTASLFNHPSLAQSSLFALRDSLKLSPSIGRLPTLHWATAVAVFFLPKHCTSCGDDMMAISWCIAGLAGVVEFAGAGRFGDGRLAWDFSLRRRERVCALESVLVAECAKPLVVAGLVVSSTARGRMRKICGRT